MICNHCGCQNQDDESFCKNCGASLIQAAPAQEGNDPTEAFQMPAGFPGEAPAQQPAYQAQPGYQQPVYQQPVYQQPVYQQPVYQQPVYQQPVYQQPVYQQPVYQQPVYQPQPAYPIFQPQQPVQNSEMPNPGGQLVFVILSFVFFVVFGVFSLMSFNAMREAIERNNVAEAKANAKKIKKFFFFSIGAHAILTSTIFFIYIIVALFNF